MIPVTIDADTLEVLIQATGCVKAMENALIAADKDPLRQRALPKITAAIEAANAALLHARRREQFPERYTPSTEEERRQLVALAERLGLGGPRAETLGEAFGAVSSPRMTIYRALQLRGFVDIGAYRESVIWSGGAITSADNPMFQHVRLTQRGRDAIQGEPK